MSSCAPLCHGLQKTRKLQEEPPERFCILCKAQPSKLPHDDPFRDASSLEDIVASLICAWISSAIDHAVLKQSTYLACSEKIQ